MVIAICVLSFLLLVAVGLIWFYIAVGKGAAKAAFDDFIEACRIKGIDPGSPAMVELIHRVGHERMMARIELERFRSVQDHLRDWREDLDHTRIILHPGAVQYIEEWLTKIKKA